MGVAEVDSGILHLASSCICKYTSVLDDVILLYLNLCSVGDVVVVGVAVLPPEEGEAPLRLTIHQTTDLSECISIQYSTGSLVGTVVLNKALVLRGVLISGVNCYVAKCDPCQVLNKNVSGLSCRNWT